MAAEDSRRPHEKAVGKDGRANTNHFYEKVLPNDPELKVTWESKVVKDADGNEQWKTTLTAKLSDGSVNTYTGFGQRKGHSKDDAVHQYLLANGQITIAPLEPRLDRVPPP